MEQRKIEILMAAYNGASYIREQLDSILAQTDTDWHLTVSDDGSTDGTDGIIDEYAERYPEKIRRVFSGRHFGGAKEHFFWLTENCGAEFIAYCDDDDVWKRDKLEKLRRAMCGEQERSGKEMPILVFSDQNVTDKNLNEISPSLMRYQRQYHKAFDYRSLLMQNVVTGGAMMINGALAKLALKCTDPSEAIMHDWWIAAAAARFGKIVYVEETLGAYRQHESNSVGAKDVSSLSYALSGLGRLGDIKNGICLKKTQAELFLRTYREQLNDADLGFLNGFARPRSGPAFFWKNRGLIHKSGLLLGLMLLG